MTRPPTTHPIVRRGSSHVSAIALITAALALVISVLAFLDVGSNVSPPTDEHAQEPPPAENESGPNATAEDQSDSQTQPQSPEQNTDASSEQSPPGKKQQPSAPAKNPPKENSPSDQSNENNPPRSSEKPSNGGGSKPDSSSSTDPANPSSPIPQAGQNTDSPTPAQRLDQSDNGSIPPQASSPPDNKVLSWKQAPRHLGYRVTVEGKIVDTHMIKSGEICFLNFSKQWRGKFYLAMFKDAFTDLSDPPQDYYLDKTIRVTGKVKNHQGRPQIEIHNIDQIQVTAPASASDA